MADEITKLDGDGGLKARLLFIYRGLVQPTYPIDGGGTQTVIATPSSNLPVMAAEILSVAEKAALDAGTDAFEIVTLNIDDSKSNLDLLTEARVLYAKRKADFISELNRKYNRAGQRFNEV